MYTSFAMVESAKLFQVEQTIEEVLEKKNERASNNKFPGLFIMHAGALSSLRKKNVKISTLMHQLDWSLCQSNKK